MAWHVHAANETFLNDVAAKEDAPAVVEGRRRQLRNVQGKVASPVARAKPPKVISDCLK